MLLLPRRRLCTLAACLLQTTSSSVRSLSSSSRMSFVTERDGKGTITVGPKKEADQSALVVWAHGLGDTAEGFADVAEYLAKELPYIKFILPTAPTQPVTMNMGMSMPSWYDITGLDERSNEACKGLAESRARIEGILEQEHASTSLSYNRMVLGGFSQGGALSVFTGLQYSHSLAGICMLSAYLPAASQFSITQPSTPILHLHGEADPLVTVEKAYKTRALLQEKGATEYTLETFPGLQHSVNMQEMQKVKEFLERVVPPDESCKITLQDPSTMSIKELKAAIRKAGLSHQAVGFMEKTEFVHLLQRHRDGTTMK